MTKVAFVKRTKRGVIAITEDGRSWYLADPFFGEPYEWIELPAIPIAPRQPTAFGEMTHGRE